MDLTEFDYYLPQDLIAQTPLEKRDGSRMMFLPKKEGEPVHTYFKNLTDYLKPGDLLVFNKTRVIPARLIGRKAITGGLCEVFLLKEEDKYHWECMVRPGRRLDVGAEIEFKNEEGAVILRATVKERREEGLRLVEFAYEGLFMEVISKIGEVPLPPYIHAKLPDSERYQTVYGYKPGSVAAPTAGLHFTQEILDQLDQIGVETAEVILNVGLGTFRPVEENIIEEHKMHSEYYECTERNAALINRAKEEGRRVICIGTTSMRVVETCGSSGKIIPGTGWTDIFIYPGYEFKIADGLLTNFHLPKSTLLMLVSAMVGKDRILDAYAEAVKERYRFFSFGDCCLFL